MKNLFIFVLMTFILSCSKDMEEGMSVNHRTSLIENRSSTELSDRTQYTQTIVGDKINNPFEINNLRRAQDSLCEGPLVQILPTHQLIKFTTLTSNQIKELGKDTSLILMDYPFNHKVISMGDFYQEGENSTESQQTLYTVVETDKQFAENVTYEIVEEYNYEFTHPLVIIESFRLTNNFQFVNDYISYEDFTNNGNTYCGKIIIDGNPCPPGCSKYLVKDEIYPLTYSWECDCTGGGTGGNGSGSGGGSGGSGGSMNACGCPIPSNPKIPAGCIEVATDGQPEGVKILQVLVADNWGQFLFPRKTYTDDNGCWQINERMSKNIWVWTKFLNHLSFERALREDNITQLLLPIKDYLGKYGEPHNNIYTLYPSSGSIKERVLWGAATAVNQVQDFNALAISNSINQLPRVLDVFVTHLTGAGAALMMNQAANLGGISGIPNPALLPDISLGIRGSRLRQNHLAYHEFAHASHFTLVGSTWWGMLAQAEFDNSLFSFITFQFTGDPYGDGSQFLDNYIAVAESWAEHIGVSFSGFGLAENLTLRNGYVPEGLYHDLIDSGTEPSFTGVIDGVSGYTNATLFSRLGASSIPQLRATLFPLLPAGNTSASYTTLFNSYGY
jgi:hypothetical protein